MVNFNVHDIRAHINIIFAVKSEDHVSQVITRLNFFQKDFAKLYLKRNL